MRLCFALRASHISMQFANVHTHNTHTVGLESTLASYSIEWRLTTGNYLKKLMNDFESKYNASFRISSSDLCNLKHAHTTRTHVVSAHHRWIQPKLCRTNGPARPNLVHVLRVCIRAFPFHKTISTENQ